MPHTTSFCPICNHPSTRAHLPFCSERCQLRDLGKWLDGSYSVPVENDFGEGDDAPDDDIQH